MSLDGRSQLGEGLSMTSGPHKLALVTLVTFAFSIPFAGIAGAVRVTDPGNAPGVGGNPRVLPPDTNPFGKSYGEWSAEQWKWLLSIPAPINPANDFTGANGAQGQSGPV